MWKQKEPQIPKSANSQFLLFLRQRLVSQFAYGIRVFGSSLGKASVGSGATSQRATSQRKTCRDTATRNRYARTHRRPVKTRMPARPYHSSAPKQPRRVPHHLVDKKNTWGKVQTGMRESSCESSDSEIEFNGASNTEITTAPVAVSSVVRFPSPSSKPPRLPPLPSRHKGPLHN
jgi:hypothetical protein